MCGHVGDEQLVFFECRLELIAAPFLGGLLVTTVLQKLLLLGLILFESLYALFFCPIIGSAALCDQVEQLIEGNLVVLGRDGSRNDECGQRCCR